MIQYNFFATHYVTLQKNTNITLTKNLYFTISKNKIKMSVPKCVFFVTIANVTNCFGSESSADLQFSMHDRTSAQLNIEKVKAEMRL